MLDSCRVNASTVLHINDGRNSREQDASQFYWQLVKELALRFIRASPFNGLTISLKQKIRTVLGEPSSPSNPPLTNKERLPSRATTHRRCADCKKSTHGKGFKEKKANLPKLKSQYQAGGEAVCKKHVLQVCLIGAAGK